MKVEKINFLYLGIFFISVATLLLEISLTRIFSVSLWYNFAFMIISIAFLGFGFAGSILAIKPIMEKNFEKNLSLFSIIFSFSVIISFILTQQIPFDPFKITWDKNQIFYISLYYPLIAMPFFFSGLIICGVFSKISENANKIYFFNLIGSGIGSFLVIFSFSFLGESTIILPSIFGAIATVFFLLSLSKKSAICFVLGFTIFLFLVYSSNLLEIKISEYKDLSRIKNYPDSRILYTKWNSFSRVDLIESKTIRYAPGLSLEYKDILPKQIGVTIDGDSLNVVTKFENLSQLRFLEYLPNSLAYDLVDNKNNKKVLIIEPKGDLDIILALYKNSSFVEISEPNPLIAEILFDQTFLKSLQNEKVRINVEDGRTFIKKIKEKYDIIFISLTDDIVKNSVGIYSLNENYLFTKEAFKELYSHLSEQGFLVVTRWIQHPPRDSIRIISIAVDALENLNENPSERIAYIRGYSTVTLFLKKTPLREEDVEKIKKFSKEKKFDLIYYPKISKEDTNIYNKLPEPFFYQMTQEILFGDRKKLYSEYLLDISSTTDEKPYFFSFFRLEKIPELYSSLGKKWEPFFESGFLVFLVFFQALFFTIILIFSPLHFFKKIKKKIDGKFYILSYFFAIGLGYMLIEISLIQKFILFLGQPIFSISLVISSLLIFSGLGSLFSEKLKINFLKKIIFLLSVLILSYLIILPLIFNQFLGESLFFRILISLLTLIPISFLMGMPFPLGIKISSRIGKGELVSWSFATNAIASVLASVLGIIFALNFGFSAVLIFSALIYLLSLVLIYKFL